MTQFMLPKAKLNFDSSGKHDLVVAVPLSSVLAIGIRKETMHKLSTQFNEFLPFNCPCVLYRRIVTLRHPSTKSALHFFKSYNTGVLIVIV